MSERGIEADDFELRSADGHITIRFSDFGFVRPQLNYHDQSEKEPRFFGPQAIKRTSEAGLGDVVTVELEAIPDGDRVDLTLILPAVLLRQREDLVETIETVAIRTTTRGSIAPQTLEGQLQCYGVIQLSGKARLLGDAAQR